MIRAYTKVQISVKVIPYIFGSLTVAYLNLKVLIKASKRNSLYFNIDIAVLSTADASMVRVVATQGILSLTAKLPIL